MHKCFSSLADIKSPGFSRSALGLLSDGKAFPTQLSFSRSDFLEIRNEIIETKKMSISGYQDKLSLRLERGELKSVAEGGTYILKPVPSQIFPSFHKDVPANEHLTMQIAAQVFKIQTAANSFIRLSDGEPAYVTRRFDRRAGKEGDTRVDQEDFAQLLERSEKGHGKSYKFDASYEEIANGIDKFCSASVVQKERFFTLLLFNYFIGNNDAHLKNFSLIKSTTRDYQLSPAYDLLSTMLHLKDNQPALFLFADGVSKDRESEGYNTSRDFLDFAEKVNLHKDRARRNIKRFLEALPETENLINRSFLSEPAKTRYLEVVKERQRMLATNEHSVKKTQS